MGWWSLRKDTKEVYDPTKEPKLDESELLVMGDGPMDTINSALKKVASAYKSGLKRKPTPEELAALLESGIRVFEEDIFDDMDERELDFVAIKLKQRPKRPKPKPGDFFAIPLPSGGYGYGRVMKVTQRRLLWMRLLAVGSDELLPVEKLQKVKVIVDLETGTSSINSMEWPIVGHVPLSDKEHMEVENELTWYIKYSSGSIQDIAEWKLAGKRGFPPPHDGDTPYKGYKGC